MALWNFKKNRCHRFLEGSAEEAEKLVSGKRPKPVWNPQIQPLQPETENMISVVIPVYNAEKYLRQCLDSIVNQNLSCQLEVIAVDDGSTDGSADILKEYEKKGMVTVIRKENGGQSSARNAGLEAAHGKYLMFADADDYLLDGCLENVLQKALKEECDIVQVQYRRICEETFYPSGVTFPGDILTTYHDFCKISGHPWGKLYKKALWEKIRFPEGYWFEDTVIHMVLFERCKKIGTVSEAGYVYRYNVEGLSYRKHQTVKCLDSYWIVLRMLQMRDELEMPLNQTMYEELIYHFTGLLYRRIISQDEKIREAVFLLCCQTMQELQKQTAQKFKLPDRMKTAEQALLKQDYGIWKLYCECF